MCRAQKIYLFSDGERIKVCPIYFLFLRRKLRSVKRPVLSLYFLTFSDCFFPLTRVISERISEEVLLPPLAVGSRKRRWSIVQEVTAIGKCNGFEIVGGRSELVALGFALGVDRELHCVLHWKLHWVLHLSNPKTGRSSQRGCIRCAPRKVVDRKRFRLEGKTRASKMHIQTEFFKTTVWV